VWSGAFTADATERWGELMLAAERPVGQGTVVVLGDYWPLTNLGVADGYELAGRLLAYLADRPSSPQATWRQMVGLLGYLVLFVLVVWRPGPARLLAIAATLAIVSTASVDQARASRPIPTPPGHAEAYSDSEPPSAPASEGAPSAARPIAYVDRSHLEVGSDRPWANDAMDGFLFTLARNGYLPLKLHEWDEARLDRAEMLVVMGPAKPFSAGQLRQLERFVKGGGYLICMIGATEANAGRALLEQFELEVQASPSPTVSKLREAEPVGQYPEPLGRLATNYVNAKDYGGSDRLVRVWFFQGWPVGCASDPKNWEVLVRGLEDVPMVIHHPIEKGAVVLIGDSRFALNHGHGYFHGEVSETAQENADFWRWMLARVTKQVDWIPPDRSQRSPEGAWRGGWEVTR
jgi:hypothetical protein